MPDKKHIFVVEDELLTLLTLEICLLSAGYEVTSAPNGLAGLEKMKRNQKPRKSVDLMICDLQMPKLSGLEMYDSLRAEGLRTPILFITGNGNRELEEQFNSRGLSRWLDKPFSPSVLLCRVEQELGE